MSGAVAILLAGVGAPGVINGALPNGSGGGGVASFQLKNDGTYEVSNGISAPHTGNWVTPANASVAAQYQAKTDETSGAFGTDPSNGSYLDMSTTRTWQEDSGATVFTLTIREKATGLVRRVQTGIQLTLA